MRAARSNRVTRVAPMINSHAPLLGLAVRPPCSCLRWPFVGVTALHAERPGTPSDVSARNEGCTPVWWVGRDHSSSSVSLRPRMAVSFGFEVVPYGLSGEWRHGNNDADATGQCAYAIRKQGSADLSKHPPSIFVHEIGIDMFDRQIDICRLKQTLYANNSKCCNIFR